LMNKICGELESPANYNEAFNAIWKRLTDYQHLKHVMKSLVLIEYLMKHSHERYVTDVKLRSDVIRRLKHYKYFNDGLDIGAEVRSKAEAVMLLIDDMDHLIKEREIAQRVEGRVQGMSYQYSNMYRNDDTMDEEMKRERDPFQPLPLEHSPEEVKYDEVEEKPKKKKKKSKKVKKDIQSTEEHEGNELEEQTVDQDSDIPVVCATQQVSPPVYAKQEESDFVSDLMSAPRPIFQSHDLITNGTNGAVSNQFNWLAPAHQDHHLSKELALFDVAQETSDAIAVPQSNDSDTKPDFSFVPQKAPEEPVHKEVDAWDLAKEISVLDNLNMTGEERKWKQNKEQRKLRETQAPKLKEMVKRGSKQVDADPFKAAVQGDNGNSMAIVPVDAWMTPMNNPQYSQAIVPYGSFPAASVGPTQYGYNYQYPYYQQQYTWQ